MDAPRTNYLVDLAAFMSALDRCSQNGTIIAYSSHNVQHFPTPKGYFHHEWITDNIKSCRKIIGPSIEEIDVRTRWLRNLILPLTKFQLIPPPWVNIQAFACRPVDLGKTPMYFIPFGDLSFDELSLFHSTRRRKSVDQVVVDCTHLFRHFDISIPFADALFWAIFHHVRTRKEAHEKKTCELPEPPLFSIHDIRPENKQAVYANYQTLQQSEYISQPNHETVETVYQMLLDSWEASSEWPTWAKI